MEQERIPSYAKILVFSIFIVSLCAIIYELLIGTISSYLMGNSIYHFSLTIGIFMFTMGIGSFFSKYIKKNLIFIFILIELIIGIVGGISVLVLYLSYIYTENFYLCMIMLISVIGIIIGIELPLLARIIRKFAPLRIAIANVFFIDYLGALIGSIIFPIVLLPLLGVIKTSILVGILNIIISLITLIFCRNILNVNKLLYFFILICFLFLGTGFSLSEKFISFFERNLYTDEVIYAVQSPYQRIVFTKWKDDYRLFLDGNIQFSSKDEYRYHESLVHPVMSLIKNRDNILILGGGDGLAARELLKYPDIKNITVVDLDKKITGMAKDFKILTKLNKNSFSNPKVKIINQDAYKFLEGTDALFNCVIIDLPDPNNTGLSKLYSKEFYRLLKKHLTGDGYFVTQSTSPYFARKTFWCVYHTIAAVFDNELAYHTYIPSFGDWGFILAGNRKINTEKINFIKNVRYINKQVFSNMLVFDNDSSETETEINTLDRPVLIDYYSSEWRGWN